MPRKRHLPVGRAAYTLPSTQIWLRIVVALFVFCLAAVSQSSECAQVAIHDHEGTLVADSINPIDALANTLA